jgi:hypothetical protein
VLTYEALDQIADSVIPILAAIALALPWLNWFQSKRQSATSTHQPTRASGALVLTLATLGAAAIGYLEQSIDNALHLWPQMGLDYSGHTALFAAVASSLWQHGIRWRWASIAIGVAYAALMIYQRYHTLADILTTAAVMIPALWAYWMGVHRIGFRRRLVAS